MVSLLLRGSLCLRFTRFSGLGSSQGCRERQKVSWESVLAVSTHGYFISFWDLIIAIEFLRENATMSPFYIKPSHTPRLLWLHLFRKTLALSSILLVLPLLHTAQMTGWHPVYVDSRSQCNSDHFWFSSCTIKVSKNLFGCIWASQCGCQFWSNQNWSKYEYVSLPGLRVVF